MRENYLSWVMEIYHFLEIENLNFLHSKRNPSADGFLNLTGRVDICCHQYFLGTRTDLKISSSSPSRSSFGLIYILGKLISSCNSKEIVNNLKGFFSGNKILFLLWKFAKLFIIYTYKRNWFIEPQLALSRPLLRLSNT